MLHSEDGVRWLLRCIDLSLTGVALPVADSKQIVRLLYAVEFHRDM